MSSEGSRAGVPAEARLDDRTEWVHRMLNYGKDVPPAVRWYVEDVPMLREKVHALDIALRASDERRERAEVRVRQVEEALRFYADENNYMFAGENILEDEGKRARQALEVGEKSNRLED